MVLSAIAFAALLLTACDGSDDSDDADDATPGASAAAPGEPTPADEPPSSTLTFAEVSQPGPFAAGVTTFDLVDTSRPTEPNRDFEGAPERTIPVEVWYPAGGATADLRDAELDASGAPYPLIVFSHGLGGTRLQSVSYVEHLASHGYVVAAPDYPLSNIGAPGGARLAAVLEQPHDVSFVIDTLLGFSSEAGHALEGAIDGELIGLTGHSLGALTTMLTTFGSRADERIDAALPIATPGCFLPVGLAGDSTTPVMVIGGSEDLITVPASNRHAFDISNAPRYFVELKGANHARFADIDFTDTELLDLGLVAGEAEGDLTEDVTTVTEEVGGDLSVCADLGDMQEDDLLTGDRQRELLRAFALSFFDAFLLADRDAQAFLEDELPGLVPEAATEFDTN